MYHEVGDEAFRPVNKRGDFIPQRDPLTDVYRPVARALNYRSEPFGVDNMEAQHEYFGFEDEGLAYSAIPSGIPRPRCPGAISAIPPSSGSFMAVPKFSIPTIRMAVPFGGRAAREPSTRCRC